MQKRLLHIIILLLWIVTSAQAQRYEYWFDGDYNQRTISAYNGGDVTASIDVSNLAPGLHYYNVRMQYNGGKWGSVNRYLFMVPGMAAEKGAARYEYWIDSDYSQKKTAAYNGGNISLATDASYLTDGLHYFNMRVQDKFGVWSPVNRYLFMVSEKTVLQPTAVDYWIDNQSSMTQTVNGSPIQMSVGISQLEPGTHQFNCRVQASNGSWSETYASEFTIEAPVLQEAFIEYYIDIDPGYGKATAVKEIEQGENKMAIDLSDVAAGAHVLYMRSHDEQGRWSSTVARPLYIYPKRHDSFVKMEYFFDDADPGNGNATPLPDFKTGTKEFISMLHTTGLQPGVHELRVRGMASDGLWSAVTSRSFLVIPSSPYLEYFFDKDPGYGKGISAGNVEEGVNHVAIDLGDLAVGAHVLYLRSHDKNRWTSTIARPLYVSKRAGITAMEYFFDDDPGEGKATPVTLPDKADKKFTFAVATNGLSHGKHNFNVRVKGLDGMWSTASACSFSILSSKRGDVNGDGKVDIVDVTTTISYILGQTPQGFNDATADVNSDGKVDIVDVTSIIDMILNAKD